MFISRSMQIKQFTCLMPLIKKQGKEQGEQGPRRNLLSVADEVRTLPVAHKIHRRYRPWLEVLKKGLKKP